MNFYIPTAIIEEKNALNNHKEMFNSLGKTALVVTGRSSAKACGALSDVASALNSQGISFFIFDKIEENPSTDTILSAVEFVKDQDIDFVIGIGGGSPMDASKAIALLLKHKGAGLDYLYDSSKSSDALPIVCVPTTCGTGSEVTGISVLTRHDNKSKGSIPHRLYPTLAFADYRYLTKLPEHTLKSSAIDALCHSIESFINSKASDYSNMLAFEAMRILGRTLPYVFLGTISDQVLSDLLHASTIAGMAIAHTGTSLPHALSYRLTYDDGIAHGTACAYFLTSFVKEAPEEYQRQILDLMQIRSIDELSALVNSLCNFSTIDKATVSKSIAEVKANPAKLATAPFTSDLNYEP